MAADRAHAALLGLAAGDAMGMPAQGLDRARAEQLLGAAPAFVAAPADNPVCPGLAAGTTTDDTAQALLLARLLVDGSGRVEPSRLAARLLDWEERMAAAGSLDLLGPSTRSAVLAVRAGADPRTTGRTGTTNGHAMRVAPVGVAVPPEPLDGLVRAVLDAGRVTHDTATAHAGAAAVAAAVSLGVDGAGTPEATAFGIAAARRAAAVAARAGLAPDTDAVADHLEAAVRSAGLARHAGALPAAPRDERAALDVVAEAAGTSMATVESVPAAFAVAALEPDDTWRAVWAAARLGGDADTIAAITGAVVGACTALAGVPAEAVTALRGGSSDLDDLAEVVAGLLALRQR